MTPKIRTEAEKHVASMGKWEKSGEVSPARAEYVIAGFLAGARWALSEAAKIAEEEGHSNVENPAIDMFERMRRSGIRWCGEWTAKRIRQLADEPTESA